MKITAVLLAAGQGTRMKSDLPKVLHPLCGRPMLWHVLEALKPATTEKPVVVVGHGAEAVQKYLGEIGRLCFAGATAWDRARRHAGRAFAQRQNGSCDRDLCRYAPAARRDLPAACRDTAPQPRTCDPADRHCRRPARLWAHRPQSPMGQCRPLSRNMSPHPSSSRSRN